MRSNVRAVPTVLVESVSAAIAAGKLRNLYRRAGSRALVHESVEIDIYPGSVGFWRISGMQEPSVEHHQPSFLRCDSGFDRQRSLLPKPLVEDQRITGTVIDVVDGRHQWLLDLRKVHMRHPMRVRVVGLRIDA